VCKAGNYERSKVMARKDKVGLFIDLANLFRSLKEQGQEPNYGYLLDKVSEYGLIIEAKAYGDFSRIPLSVQKDLIAEGIRLIHCPGNQNGETKLDDPLMVEDIHDSLIQKKIATFVLVTGDAHFAPLVTTIRSRHRRKAIVLAAPSATSAILKSSADDFISLTGEKDPGNVEHLPERQTLAA
jgi:uncharacterized LabA/DUF88 family protein